MKDDESPVVLLLDERGLTLHGKAQADLLRFFREKLAPHHQMIYSTDSPFMVPADELVSVRIVEDQVNTRGPRRIPIGTKVRDDVLTRDPDTLFPLQGALATRSPNLFSLARVPSLLKDPVISSMSKRCPTHCDGAVDPDWTHVGQCAPLGASTKSSPSSRSLRVMPCMWPCFLIKLWATERRSKS